MIVGKQGTLTALIENQPVLLRPLIRSACSIPELEALDIRSRTQHSCSRSEAVLNHLRIGIDIRSGDLAKIPASGPVVVVANHPFGLLDGLILHYILERARSDIRILANSVICALDGFVDSLISIDVFAPRACPRNVLAARETLRWLSSGHGIATFPSGIVSHWNRGEKRIADPEWQDFAVRCALTTRASIVPVYFEGRNSLTFQLAGLVHPMLRTVRLSRELLNKRGATVKVRIGAVMSYRELAEAGDEQTATRHIRGRVYLLRNYRTAASNSSREAPAFPAILGAPEPIGPPVPGVLTEIEALESRGKRLVDSGSYAVYGEVGYRIPLLLCEIGRLRELTFRAVREGTGKRIDSDEFDRFYTHLILWHKPTASVVGGYRLAWTEDLAQPRRRLYTSKLFRYAPEFFSRIGPAVEVGRSFITRQHQREYDPLLLLWQAIGHCVAARPDSPVLFGTVSISTEYPQAARELIVQFLRERRFREDLAPFVSPRRAFRQHLLQKHEMRSIIRCLREIDDLPIHDLSPLEGVPVLLRHYLRLGGRVAGFNIDSRFSGVLDALLIVDLRKTPRKLLNRYMGAKTCDEFLRSTQASDTGDLASTMSCALT